MGQSRTSVLEASSSSSANTQTLHDELLSQQIEISGLTQRNASLQADNASLLQRWLDKMNLTADEMNSEFEREAAEADKEDKEDFRKGGKA